MSRRTGAETKRSGRGDPMEVDKHHPHVFEEVIELPMTPPFGVDHGPAGSGPGGGITQPPIPGRISALCGICHRPRTDRLHIDGETIADGQSPQWG
jgi:hypothetical protein